MRILVYRSDGASAPWVDDLKAALPQAQVRIWQPGDQAGCDYAVLWAPPPELLASLGTSPLQRLVGAFCGALQGWIHASSSRSQPEATTQAQIRQMLQQLGNIVRYLVFGLPLVLFV